MLQRASRNYIVVCCLHSGSLQERICLLMYTGMKLEPLRKRLWDLKKHIVVFGEAFAAFWILAFLIVSCINLTFGTQELEAALAVSKFSALELTFRAFAFCLQRSPKRLGSGCVG